MTNHTDPKRATLIAALKAAAVADVTISYDGYGDEGQIESITAHNAEGLEIDLKALPSNPGEPCGPLEDLVDDYAWHLIEAHHDGFENNQGTYGEVAIDVVNDAITIDHNDRYIDSVNTTTEL